MAFTVGRRSGRPNVSSTPAPMAAPTGIDTTTLPGR